MYCSIKKTDKYTTIKSPSKITRIIEDDYGYTITIPKNVKVCNKCEEIKELNEFGNSANKPDGKNIYCKECQADFNKKYKETENGKKSSKKSSDKWKDENREKISQYNKKYYQKNKKDIIKNKRKTTILEKSDIILPKNKKKYDNRILKSLYDKFGNNFCYSCESPIGNNWIEFINRKSSMVYVRERKMWIPVCKNCKTKLK